MSDNAFCRFIGEGFARGGFGVDDAIAAVLPLMRQVAAIHEEGRVASLRGTSALVVREELHLGIEPEDGIEPKANLGKLAELSAPRTHGVEIIGERKRESDGGFITGTRTLEVADAEDEITRPVYLPGHVSWEHAIGHHDALTDIFSLGMIFASLACGLDFSEREELERFADSRGNLFALTQRLHPVVAVIITGMTDLKRATRSQDLPSLIRGLETYREQPVEADLGQLDGLETAGKSGRRRIIQTHLRDRLFEISRRNRLIYFKPTQASLNLTNGSVPLVMDHRNIRPDQLLYWHKDLATTLGDGKSLPLGKWLRLEEAPYLPGQLDKLISEARRSRSEYGFSQLRLVVAFLRWNNLKESPGERIHSPLLLMPVELVKRKGVKDLYTLEPHGTEVEVNPALRHLLKQTYDLDLPVSIDLRETALEDFHAKVQSLVHATEPGVTLTLQDKPRIRLIHEKARQSMDQYRRRLARQGRMVAAGEKLDYSYHREDFRPLGLQMFQKLVQPSPLPLREMAGAPPAFRTPFMVPPVEMERKMYEMVEEGEGNPYSWEFDLCSLTLANFNYRKMTLVRDYANLIENDTPNAAFDRIFTIEPKAAVEEEPVVLSPSEQHLIIAADATQIGAIAKARSGESLIIQGPPGTGKSQTITNLIADYVARGKRVLFVCEKRAAIDVVFHRLRQQGLDQLCCLIHDSQTDKKEFILNLKQTYEQWQAGDAVAGSGGGKREAALRAMESELAALEKHVEQLEGVPDGAGTALLGLLRRLIELRGTWSTDACPALTAEQEEILPDYQEWLEHGDAVIRLSTVLSDLGARPVFAEHALRGLSEKVITHDAPLQGLAGRLESLEGRLDDLDDALAQSGLPAEHWDTLAEVGELLDFAAGVQPLAARGLLGLLDVKGACALEFARLAGEHGKKRKALDAAREKTIHWTEKLPAEDTAAALALAPKVAGVFGFLNPAWWRLRNVLRAKYDFSKHAVAPSWEHVLQGLAAEHAAADELEAIRKRGAEIFASDDLTALAAEVRALTDEGATKAVAALRARLLETEDGQALAERLGALAPDFRDLLPEVEALLTDHAGASLSALAEMVRGIREELEVLPELLPALRDLAGTASAVRRSVRSLPLTVEQFEAACARKTLEALYRRDRGLQRFDMHVLQQKLDRLAAAHRQWLDHNAGWINDSVRRRFVEHVRVTHQPAAALTPEEKVFKKSYATGRRELEHEFGKTMRYKSIRDLAAGDSGSVVRDLKPIWLMSPLSVSDTLPLENGVFDVVIFDEASQIPVEDAIPAAYRAPQVIVVGDEMQLPPTSFFSSASGSDEEVTVEEEGEEVNVMMDADSFLTQCARNLPSTLLAWHYRSRYESLISFSNAAFYGGELYTIPDRQLAVPGVAVDLEDEEDAAGRVPEILAKPVSFVLCGDSPYIDRRNPGEAAVVARLVRGLLQSGTKLSIGVAAFSEAQQGEIESALEKLAAADPEFAIRLEAEYVREEDDQFCGLFVKNLENVQGDERDIMIMSVCYGPDPAGKMRMNFGPINQRGGEKRLNVIFSRARHHMVLVSSIRHTAITNDYNDGARALKGFLQYAECLSNGNVAMARQVLDGLNPMKRAAMKRGGDESMVAMDLAKALASRGWIAETDAGQSRFRCDIAVRAEGADRHQLAVLVDGGGARSALERFHTRPEILRAFGWQVAVVMTKDWWHEPEAVLVRIERLLRKEIEDMGVVAVEESAVEEVVPAKVVDGGTDGVVDSVEEVSTAVVDAAEEVAMPVMRRFEFTDGKSNKFWEAGREDALLVIRYGRIGTAGQSQRKPYADEGRATRELEKLIREKLGKGYVEVGG